MTEDYDWIIETIRENVDPKRGINWAFVRLDLVDGCFSEAVIVAVVDALNRPAGNIIAGELIVDGAWKENVLQALKEAEK